MPLKIVCFRAHPPGLAEEQLNELNVKLGDALRPAIVNWQTQEHDIDLLVDVVRGRVAEETSSS